MIEILLFVMFLVDEILAQLPLEFSIYFILIGSRLKKLKASGRENCAF